MVFLRLGTGILHSIEKATQFVHGTPREAASHRTCRRVISQKGTAPVALVASFRTFRAWHVCSDVTQVSSTSLEIRVRHARPSLPAEDLGLGTNGFLNTPHKLDSLVACANVNVRRNTLRLDTLPAEAGMARSLRVWRRSAVRIDVTVSCLRRRACTLTHAHRAPGLCMRPRRLRNSLRMFPILMFPRMIARYTDSYCVGSEAAGEEQKQGATGLMRARPQLLGLRGTTGSLIDTEAIQTTAT